MRLPILAAAALLPLAPATAATERELDEVERALGDLARQHAMARALGTMAEIVLDVPLAPILRPLAEAAGEDPRRIDPDATLRKVSPGAGAVPRAIERQLPRAMDAVAGMSGALGAIIPQLRETADRLREALPAAGMAEAP
jgi:hypothetical protein